jgi:hypothetical protein
VYHHLPGLGLVPKQKIEVGCYVAFAIENGQIQQILLILARQHRSSLITDCITSTILATVT